MQIPKLDMFIKNPRTILAFDPGETTGACVFHGPELTRADQLSTKELSSPTLVCLASYIDRYNIHEVVIEDYRVYGWLTDQHSFAGLHTPKLIGMLITLCIVRNLPFTLRMAQPAKAFVTDEKLEAWNLMDKGRRHSRDAMRHAIFQMIFPTKDISTDEKYAQATVTTSKS